MILSSIAAMAKNRAIGMENKLIWHIPEDLKFFREKTKNKVLIMGRKTFESLGKPLPNRIHIVITRQPEYKYDHEKVKIVKDIDSAINLAEKIVQPFSIEAEKEVFICGGGEIYKQCMEKIDKLYLTIINREYAADAYFPEFDEKRFSITSKRSVEAAGDVPSYEFLTYEKIK